MKSQIANRQSTRHSFPSWLRGFVAACLLATAVAQADPLGTAFTYQGHLEDGSGPVTDTCDFAFALYEDASGTMQVGTTQPVAGVAVAGGVFTVGPPDIDFGEGAFNGEARWLEVSVCCPATCTPGALSPLVELTAAPYALQTRGLLVDGEGLHVNGNVLAGDPVVGFNEPVGISPDNYMVTGSDDLNRSTGFIAAVIDGVQNSRVWMTLDAAAKRLDLTHGWTTGGDLDYFFSRNKLAILQGGTDDERVMTIGGPGNNVGIGTPTPAAKLDVAGTVRMTGFQMPSGAAASRVLTSDASGVGTWQSASLTLPFAGSAMVTGGNAIEITNTASSGLSVGVRGTTQSNIGYAVYGRATATSGGNVGVIGETASTNGTAVRGTATAASGQCYGGFFSTNSTSGRGVHAIAGADTGTTYAVSGFNYSENGRGVYGLALDSSGNGTSYGVYGDTNNPVGYGVYGEGPTFGAFGNATSGSGTNYGVYGSASGTSGRGVYGIANSSSGVNYGVRGFTSSSSGYAVYASGDMGASGNKPFRIDHPTDPENKYLLHYSSEAPEPQNFYNGIVMLDDRGETTVELPDYFAAINRDPRYLLTPIGTAMPGLHVADEIADPSLAAGARTAPGQDPPACSFRIAGGTANGRVSWEVKAVRNDRWNQLRGTAPVVVKKDAAARGKYQHPELYGQPPEKGVDFQGDLLRSSIVSGESTD